MLTAQQEEIEKLKDYIRMLEKRVSQLEENLSSKNFDDRIVSIVDSLISSGAASNS